MFDYDEENGKSKIAEFSLFRPMVQPFLPGFQLSEIGILLAETLDNCP